MENENNKCFNINESDELTKQKIFDSALIKELRKYKEENTKLKHENEILYSLIENLEEENKALKSEISSMKNQNPHEETMEMNIPNEEIKEGLKRYKSFPEEGKSKKNMHTIHEKYKNYQCESCSESFSQAAYLEKHIYTIHESHRDHKCEYCGKSFSQSQNVKKTLGNMSKNPIKVTS